MAKIFLIRHGEVEWNRRATYMGSTDLPLNSQGRLQADRLADRLETEDISAVYSSDLSRARETAEIIAGRIRLPIQITPEIREIDYGEWDGVPEADVPKRYGDIYSAWRANPAEVRIPGGETFQELADRAFPAFSKIAEGHGDQNIVVVAHKSTNRVILCCLLGIHVNNYRRIGQGNAAFNVIETAEGGGFLVNVINERCHLLSPSDAQGATN